MATSVSDEVRQDQAGERSASSWGSIARAEVIWTLVGLTLLVAVLCLAVAGS